MLFKAGKYERIMQSSHIQGFFLSVPGPVANLTVTEVTLSLVNVTWDVPRHPNGNITHYIVQFYSADGKLLPKTDGYDLDLASP